MAFIDLAQVDIAEEVSENAKMLVEDESKIVRTSCPRKLSDLEVDAELETADKTIVGAINEVNGKCDADLVILVNNHPADVITQENMTIINGDVMDIMYRLKNNDGYPKAKIRFVFNDEYSAISREIDAKLYYYGGYLFVSYITSAIGLNFFAGFISLNESGHIVDSSLKRVALDA